MMAIMNGRSSSWIAGGHRLTVPMLVAAMVAVIGLAAAATFFFGLPVVGQESVVGEVVRVIVTAAALGLVGLLIALVAVRRGRPRTSASGTATPDDPSVVPAAARPPSGTAGRDQLLTWAAVAQLGSVLLAVAVPLVHVGVWFSLRAAGRDVTQAEDFLGPVLAIYSVAAGLAVLLLPVLLLGSRIDRVRRKAGPVGVILPVLSFLSALFFAVVLRWYPQAVAYGDPSFENLLTVGYPVWATPTVVLLLLGTFAAMIASISLGRTWRVRLRQEVHPAAEPNAERTVGESFG